jgi:hypothetical protein
MWRDIQLVVPDHFGPLETHTPVRMHPTHNVPVCSLHPESFFFFASTSLCMHQPNFCMHSPVVHACITLFHSLLARTTLWMHSQCNNSCCYYL